MKKGLIIIGLALLAVFLFWEGQRKGLNTLAMSPSSSSETQINDQSNLNKEVAAMPSSSEKYTEIREESLSSKAVAAPAQMQLRVKKSGQTRVSEKPFSLDAHVAVSLRENKVLAATPWKTWAGVRAVPARDFSEQSGQELVGKYGGYYIVKDDSMDGDERSFQSKKPFVVLDERTGKVGIVPGTVILTVASPATFKTLQSEYGLQVRGEFTHLNLYIVSSSQESFDLNSFISILQQDPRVQKAELEIVSRNYVKN